MSIVLMLHSLWRWVVLAVAVAAIVKAALGWRRRAPYGRSDRQLGMFFTMVIDIQALVGLILWFGRQWYAVLTGALPANGTILFVGLVHPGLMLVALALAHVGYSRSRSPNSNRQPASGAVMAGAGSELQAAVGAPTDQQRTAALFYLSSFIVVLLAIPWDRLAR